MTGVLWLECNRCASPPRRVIKPVNVCKQSLRQVRSIMKSLLAIQEVAARLKSRRSEQALHPEQLSGLAMAVVVCCFFFSISLVICHKVKESEGQQCVGCQEEQHLVPVCSEMILRPSWLWAKTKYLSDVNNLHISGLGKQAYWAMSENHCAL